MKVLLGYAVVSRDGHRIGEVGTLIDRAIFADAALADARAARYVARQPRGRAFVVPVYADLDPVSAE